MSSETRNHYYIAPDEVPADVEYLWCAPELYDARIKNGWQCVPPERHPRFMHTGHNDPYIQIGSMVLLQKEKLAVREQRALDRDKGWDTRSHASGRTRMVPQAAIKRPYITVQLQIYLSDEEFLHCRDSGVSSENWVATTLENMQSLWDETWCLVANKDHVSFRFERTRARRRWCPHWLYRLVTRGAI